MPHSLLFDVRTYFFLAKNVFPKNFGSRGRIRSSAKKNSWESQSFRLASYGLYSLTLDPPRDV